MLEILGNRTYRRLFSAQVIALIGTGLATVALGLLAFELAGGDAGAVLGTALAVKMIAYVGVAPIVGAFADRLPRRALLVAMDMVRAIIALVLPFVDAVWQIYLLVFLLQSCSAAFTPTFQATIPEVLPEERDYTRALSLSRLAYDLESLLSPSLAAALLALMSFHWLFAGTVFGFAASAMLILSVVLPQPRPAPGPVGLWEKTTRGMRIYFSTPRLRGLLALSLATAAAGAMVIVNTVVIVRELLGLSEADVATALAAFGAGSMLVALLLPRVLEHVTDRSVMLSGAVGLGGGLLAFAAASQIGAEAPAYRWLLALWLALGAGYSAVLTPTGRLLRRSAEPADRPALYSAQFALSHACWLLTYPLAGWLGARAGMETTSLVLCGLTVAATFAAARSWPVDDPDVVEHVHADLEPDHPHVAGGRRVPDGVRHAHSLVIDENHANWPSHGAPVRARAGRAE